MTLPPPSQELLQYHFDPRVVPPSGTGSSGVCCIAEAPGRHEAEDGLVLHPKADAGSVFDRALRRAKIPRESLTLSNCCWMRPPNNELSDQPYLYEALKYWMPFNEALIQERKPKVIVLLGNVSLSAFTEFGSSDKTTIQHLQGYTLIDEKRGCYLLPALHPSFILHGQQAHTQTLIWALQRAFQLVKDGLKLLPTRYVTHPTEADMLQFERGFNHDSHILDYDIETPESSKLDEAELEDTEEDISYTILRASMCYDPVSGYAISFPWQAPFIEIFKRMMGKAQRRGVWNNYFDEPRIRAAGILTPGKLIDRMQSWRFLQPTLPASLEYASPLLGWTNPPWKFKSDSDPELYSATDAHALAWNGRAIEAALKARGMLECHDRHVTKVYEITQKMSRNGLPYCTICDICARGGKCEDLPEDAPEHAACATGFKRKLEKLKKEREDELQLRVPDVLKPTKQSKGYKKTPKSTEGLVRRKFAVTYSDATMLEQEAVKAGASEPTLRAIADSPDELKIQVERWAQLKPFLPTSHVQMKALIKWGGFKVGTNRKTKKETSDDETKRKIIARCINSTRKKDQEFGQTLKMCREVSQLSKVLGTYVKGWKVGADGRVHAIPGFWGKMFRISWRNPNISGTIQDKQEEFIAAGFRKCVRTSSERILVESDWKGIEGVIVGYLANDPDYTRLARIGVHDYFASHLLYHRGKIPHSEIPSLSLSDEELKVVFKSIKKRFPKDRDDAKHCIAEGQLVLTDQGLVPIQNITLDHKLWDGVEWVSHEGVIDQGIRKVIAHDGLIATPDHQVVTTGGHILSFGEAASALVGIETTGLGRKAVWTRHYYILERSARKRIRESSSRMYQVPSEELDRQRESTKWKNERVPPLCSSSNGRSTTEIRVEVGGDDRTLQTPPKPQICSLRWEGDQGTIQVSPTLHRMGIEESATPNLPGNRDRSEEQQRTLCTGEFKVSYESATKSEQIQQSLVELQREHNIDMGVRQSLREVMDAEVDPSRVVWRRDHSECSPTGSDEKLQVVEEPSEMVSFARVYDIVNAGPRRCFTVSGKLVLNCVHGQNYGLGANLMSSMYEMPLHDAEELIRLYFGLFPKIKEWQEKVKAEAHKKVWIVNVYGYTMPFWEIHRWNSRRYEILAKTYDRIGKMGADGMPWKPNMRERGWIREIEQILRADSNLKVDEAISKLCWDLGDDAKSAISFLPRDTAAGMLRELILRVEPLVEEGFLCASAHDAVLCDCPRSQQSRVEETLYTEMTRPVPQLKNAQYPEGLVVDVEVKAGPSWDSENMEVIEVGKRLAFSPALG